MSWKKKGTWKEQKEGVIKQRNKLQCVYSTQRDNKETGLNKSNPCSVLCTLGKFQNHISSEKVSLHI